MEKAIWVAFGRIPKGKKLPEKMEKAIWVAFVRIPKGKKLPEKMGKATRKDEKGKRFYKRY